MLQLSSPYGYLSTLSLMPAAASSRLAPWVVLFSSITTPV